MIMGKSSFHPEGFPSHITKFETHQKEMVEKICLMFCISILAILAQNLFTHSYHYKVSFDMSCPIS